MVWFVCGWQVKLCDPLVTRGPYLSALEIRSLLYNALYKFAFFTLLYYTAGQELCACVCVCAGFNL